MRHTQHAMPQLCRLIPLGRLVATPHALALLEKAKLSTFAIFARHAIGSTTAYDAPSRPICAPTGRRLVLPHVLAGAGKGPMISDELARAIDAFAQHPHVLVACDYDGTLAPIVDNPGHARPDRHRGRGAGAQRRQRAHQDPAAA